MGPVSTRRLLQKPGKPGSWRAPPVHYVTKHLQQGIESDHFRVKRPMPWVGCFQAFHTRKTLIVALARKLLIGLWRMVTTGEAPAGVVLRAASREDADRTSSWSYWSLANRISLVSDDDPRWRSPEAWHGLDTVFENGPAAPELRRRCA